MKSALNLGHSAVCELVRPTAKPQSDKIDVHGKYHVEHWRDGKLLNEFDVSNYITNTGRELLLNCMFNATTEITVWYMGLVNGSTSPTFNQADNYLGINNSTGGPSGAGNGWTEPTSTYTDDANGGASTRPTWASTSASLNGNTAQVLNSATPTLFTIAAATTIAGLFLVGGAVGAKTQGDHATGAGLLWSAAAFTGGSVAVQIGDQLKITYTVTA